jgi:transposase-like protein
MLAGMTTTRHDLLAWVHAQGLAALDDLFREEAVALAGAKGRHQASRTHHHWGTTETELTFGGRRVQVQRPRVRGTTGGEATLPSVARFRERDPLTARMMQQLLAGVSTRLYDASLEARLSGRRTRGTSKSAVSRSVVRRTRQRLHEQLTRRLEGLEVVALFVDGIVVAQQTVIVVLGITRDGTKVPLGLRLGSTENAVVCTDLLQDLLVRGLTLTGRVLCVIDGGKGLRKALGDVFGDAALIQRCQLHKGRNLDALVPKARQAYVRAALRQAYRATSRGAPPAHGARDVAGAERPCRCRGQCAGRARGNAHGAEAGAAAGLAPLLRHDELHRESHRDAAARHAEHQALARRRHAAPVARARSAASRRAFPAHQAAWRAGHARDGARRRGDCGARRVSHRRQTTENLAQDAIFARGSLCRYTVRCGELTV